MYMDKFVRNVVGIFASIAKAGAENGNKAQRNLDLMTPKRLYYIAWMI